VSTVEALETAIDAENAAIFAYGTSTAFIGSADRGTVAEYIAAHRVRRTELDDALAEAGGQPRPAAAGYTLPEEMTGADSAATILLGAEEDCAQAYFALIDQADGAGVRRLGVDALTDCARRAAHWRSALGKAPVTVAFPGQPSQS